MKYTCEECIKCQWCCHYANVPIPGGLEYAYLYWVKGRRVYWEPFTHEWYWLAVSPCQHISPDGCMIQTTKPRLCRDWYCPFGPDWIDKRFNILLDAGNRIMEQYKRKGMFK